MAFSDARRKWDASRRTLDVQQFQSMFQRLQAPALHGALRMELWQVWGGSKPGLPQALVLVLLLLSSMSNIEVCL